jgi:hypothetical protein
MKISRLFVAVFAFLILMFLATSSEASVRKHALTKIARVAGRVALAAPKVAAVGLKDTIGGVLFVTEAGVDVVHAGTFALSKAAGMELKHNPFAYVDKGVSYVDSGLEVGYQFFFNAQI